MTSWTEIYNKFKDTELMKEFEDYCCIDNKEYFVIDCLEIKDIWGYLICFAETKGVDVAIVRNYDSGQSNYEKECVGRVHRFSSVSSPICPTKNSVEDAMLWCANKFFEITK